MYYDDGETIDVNEQYFYSKISMAGGELKMEVVHDGYQGISNRIIEKIHILGVQAEVTTVFVTGLPLTEENFHYEDGGLFLSNLNLAPNDNFIISLE